MKNTARTVALRLTIPETVATHHNAPIAKYQDLHYKMIAKKHVMPEIIHIIRIKFT